MWQTIQNRKSYTNTNTHVKQYQYDLILQKTRIEKLPIVNECIKVFIYGRTGKSCAKAVIVGIYQRTLQQNGKFNRRGLSEIRDGQSK